MFDVNRPAAEVVAVRRRDAVAAGDALRPQPLVLDGCDDEVVGGALISRVPLATAGLRHLDHSVQHIPAEADPPPRWVGQGDDGTGVAGLAGQHILPCRVQAGGRAERHGLALRSERVVVDAAGDEVVGRQGDPAQGVVPELGLHGTMCRDPRRQAGGGDHHLRVAVKQVPGEIPAHPVAVAVRGHVAGFIVAVLVARQVGQHGVPGSARGVVLEPCRAAQVVDLAGQLIVTVIGVCRTDGDDRRRGAGDLQQVPGLGAAAEDVVVVLGPVAEPVCHRGRQATAVLAQQAGAGRATVRRHPVKLVEAEGLSEPLLVEHRTGRRVNGDLAAVDPDDVALLVVAQVNLITQRVRPRHDPAEYIELDGELAAVLVNLLDHVAEDVAEESQLQQRPGPESRKAVGTSAAVTGPCAGNLFAPAMTRRPSSS